MTDESLIEIEIILKLYVNGTSQNSRIAVKNLDIISQNAINNVLQTEVVDVSVHPEVLDEMDLLALPTLDKISPGPRQRFVGNLSILPDLLEKLAIQVAPDTPLTR